MQSISLPPFFVKHLLEFFMGHKLFVSIQNGYIEIGISVTCISEMTIMEFDSVSVVVLGFWIDVFEMPNQTASTA